MYSTQNDLNRMQQRAQAVTRKQLIEARRHAINFRTKGIPMPDAITERFPLVHSSLGEPYPELGVLPLGISAGISGITSGLTNQFGGIVKKIPLIGGLFAKNTSSKNEGRARTNSELAVKARAGDVAAWDQLSARSKPGALPYNMWQDAATKLAGIPRGGNTGIPLINQGASAINYATGLPVIQAAKPIDYSKQPYPGESWAAFAKRVGSAIVTQATSGVINPGGPQLPPQYQPQNQQREDELPMTGASDGNTTVGQKSPAPADPKANANIALLVGGAAALYLLSQRK